MPTVNRRLSDLVSGSASLDAGDVDTGTFDNAQISATSVTQHVVAFDDNKIQANIALLGFKVAVNNDLVKYNLQDQIVDEYETQDGIDTGASTNQIYAAAVSYGAQTGSIGTVTTTFNINGASADAGSVQSLTINADTVSATIEGWGGRGGASTDSWKKNDSSTIVNTSSVAGSEEGGGFTVRLKGTYSGFEGGETIKIAVGKFGEGAIAGYGCHSGGGGASWVLLDHGASSTIGQTRGVANTTRYTPLLVAGGGGGAAARDGLSGGYNQLQTPWTRHADTDANLATSNGATRQGTVTGVLTSSNTGKYTTGTDDGEGGTALSSGTQGGGGGAGFLAEGGRAVGSWDNYGDDHEGSHPFHGSTPFEGGQDAGSSGGSGRSRGGFGGGGGGHLAGAGGGGGFSGGSASGTWSDDGANGIGGGSLFGSTVAIGGGYNNAITFTQVTNVLANGANASPVSGKVEGRVIIVETTDNVMVDNLTLQSTDTEAEVQPTKADMVILIEDVGTGVGVVNTNIKGFVSRDSGTTFTEGVLVDEGDWGTDKRILAFHDLDIDSASQPDGVLMCYKITTHSASLVFDTRIHATSLGWK